jgi:small conductance mechanosensitive channel
VLLAVTPTTTPPGSGSTPSPSSVFTNPVDRAQQACHDTGLSVCTLIRDWTGSPRAGEWAQVLLGAPLKILLVLVVAVLARTLLHRAIARVVDRFATGRAGLGRLDEHLPSATAMLTTSPLLSARREQRSRTMGSVLRSLITAVIATVALLMVLQALGLSITPLLASAGIVGVAVGFGSQSLVKDVISGLFMIVEDQYGVGDVVDLGEASGVVEAVGLRVTRLRDTDGTVWYIRNGEVLRVGNRSQGWARAVLDVGIAYDQDVTAAQDLLLDVARGLQHDPQFGPLVLEDPEVWGIESVSAEGVAVRLVVKTEPLQQWAVARELRRRIKEAFDAAGIQVAYPHGAIWLKGDPPAPAPHAPAAPPSAGPAPSDGPEV